MNRDVVLITGGNSGIGFECARELARAGWHVVIASRDRQASAEAVRRIAGESGDGAASEMGLDLGSTASVRALGRDIQAGHVGLRALVCNARLQMTTGPQLSADGYEVTFAVNHLGAIDQQDRIWVGSGSDKVTRFPATDPTKVENFKSVTSGRSGQANR